MQLISLLMSLLLTLLSSAPFLAPMQEAVHEISVSNQAKAAITQEQRNTAAAALDALAEEAEQAGEESWMNFFPINLLEDGNLQALAVGYMYACLFSLDDGLTIPQVIQIQAAYAAQAQIVARGVYTVLLDDYWKQDACAHYLWGQYTTRGIGQKASRIHLSNYELAVLLARPLVDFLEESYAALRAQGQTQNDARLNAMAECAAYALNRRVILLEEVSDFEVWNRQFSNSEVMDLWNDNAGTQAALTNGMKPVPFRQFLAAWDNGELIKDETDEAVTAEKRLFIFENTNLWNPKVAAAE